MAGANEDSDNAIQGLTYFYDFLEVLEREYAFASVDSVLDDIAFYREFATARAELKRRDDGVLLLKSPIGRGHFAIVELEFDIDGILQPVMEGFLRN